MERQEWKDWMDEVSDDLDVALGASILKGDTELLVAWVKKYARSLLDGLEMAANAVTLGEQVQKMFDSLPSVPVDDLYRYGKLIDEMEEETEKAYDEFIEFLRGLKV